jgi:lysophospholipase L1-like esterase
MTLLNGCTAAICEYGINDLYDLGNNDVVVRGNLLKVWIELSVRGMKVYQTTITPRSTSTDGWVTTANQTPQNATIVAWRTTVNDWIRAGSPIDPTTKAAVAVGTSGALLAGQAGHPLTGYFEIADLAETARNSSIWKAGYTTDGLHPTGTAAAALAAGIDVSKFALAT